MSEVDHTAVKARDLMLENKIPVDPEIRACWARFLISLVFRNPEEISKFKLSGSHSLRQPDPVLQQDYESSKNEGDPALFEDWLEQNDPTYFERESVLMITDLMQHKNVTNLIRMMQWRVINTSNVSRRLMTSDRPVVMTNGIGRYDGHVGIPISPTRLFVAFTCSSFADEFCSMPIGKIVRSVNEAVVGQAKKYVYAVDGANVAQVRREMGKRGAPSFVHDVEPRST